MAKGKKGKHSAAENRRPHGNPRPGVSGSRLQESVRRIDWKLFDQQVNWLSQQTLSRHSANADEMGEGLLNLLAEIEHAAEQDGLKPTSST